MLSKFELQQLVEFENGDHPVLSVYLHVDPQERSVESYRLALRNLLGKAEKVDKADLTRVQNYIEMGYNRQGRSVAMFSCAAADFWWAQNFQVPMPDKVFVSWRPYIRPLATLLDTYERYGVIHVDQEGARLYIFHMGNLESADGYLGEEVKLHRAGGWSAQRYQRQEMQQARQNLQDAAEMAETFYREADTRRLILAGTDKNVAHFKELLSHRLRAMVVGQLSAGATATPGVLRDQAAALVQKAADEEAAVLADQVITTVHKGGNAILGLAETLTAVQTGRAQHVVVLADYEQSAYRFVDSGHILLELNEKSELASGKIQSLPDAVDSVLRRALAQGIGVTILDQHSGLATAGKIGALTRY